MNKKRRYAAKILNLAVTVLLIVLIGCQAYSLLAKQVLGKPYAGVFGLHMAVVLSGSMEPAISPNDLILVRDQKDYQVGDIVMYQTPGLPVTHRIVAEEETGIVTKGDANNTADAPIIQSQIIGKVILVIPAVGAVMKALQTPLGMLCLVVLLLVLIVLPAGRKERNGGDT